MELPGMVFTNLMLHEDTLIATGIGITEPPQSVQAVIFAKLDTNGNLLMHKVITDSLNGNFTPGKYPRGFLKTSDGSGYVLLSHVFERKNGVAIKIDNEGNTLWTREYEDEESRQDAYRSIVETDNGFLIAGSKQDLDYSLNLFTMKTDKQGQKVWENLYGDENNRWDSFEKIIVENENEFIISSSTGDEIGVPWQEWQNTVKIFAIDSLGNEKWSWESAPSLEELWIKGLQKTDDGHWAYATARGEFEVDGYQKRQARFVIRDSSFDIVEERLLDDLDIGYYNYLLNLIPVSSGGWLGVGGNFEWVADPVGAEAHVYGWTVRIDETGDTLWTRNDLAFPDTLPHASLQFLHSAVELPSGSLIAAGYYMPDGPGPNLGILVKVDRNGCMEVIDCHPVSTEESVAGQGPLVTVYPNPAQSTITIETANPLLSENQWLLYDQLGNLVHVEILRPGLSLYELNLPATIADGMYYWHFHSTGPLNNGGKLLILR
ncbi:MAG: hypothetical protein AAFZ15_31310 [Bacteroidota bacterium]